MIQKQKVKISRKKDKKIFCHKKLKIKANKKKVIKIQNPVHLTDNRVNKNKHIVKKECLNYK